MRILNFGSLNVDYVYRLPRTVRPGETVASRSRIVFAGGKGANQSVALARAGAVVAHAGKVGGEGRWLINKLSTAGVDTKFIEVSNHATGHAVIQVDDAGQNAIFLFPGTNHEIEPKQVDATIGQFAAGDILLLQNEVNDLPYLIEAGAKRGMNVWINPAPFDERVRQYPLDKVAGLIVNENEGIGLSGLGHDATAEQVLAAIVEKLPKAEVILTRGGKGCFYRSPSESHEVPAVTVAKVVDTTGAGDAFIGYFLAARGAGMDAKPSLERAAKAAAMCVSRPGAMDSIPVKADVDKA